MIRKLFTIIILLYAAASVALGQTRQPEVKVAPKVVEQPDTSGYDEQPYFILIGQSEKALEEGDYEAAGLRLVEAMSIEPDNELNVALLSNLGMIYYYDDRDSMALVVLDRAIERAPRLIMPRENRARVLTGMGRDKEAFEEYGNILTIDSLHLDARYLHGMIALYSGDLATAQRDFDVLENVIPLSTKTRLAKATMYSMTGNEREAISLFRKLIELEPAPEYYSRMIACMLVLDELGDASDAIGAALEKYPNDPELFYYRAILNKRRYRNEEAKRDARHAIELGADPNRVRAIFR